MAVHVIFFTPRGIGSIDAPGVGDIRVREAVTVPGETTTQAREGEVVMVVNEDAVAILVANGKAPVATLTAATGDSGAGLVVGASKTSPVIVPHVNDKFAIAALA